MVLATDTEMGPSQIDDFLGRRETGVLSLADGAEPYAIPISYGYHATERTVYLRLVSTPESRKRRFLQSSPRAQLVVYDELGDVDTYVSVVASGTLHEIEAADLTPDEIEQFGGAKRPLFEIWGQARADLDVALYRLEPDELSGRRTVVEREA